MVWRVAAFVSGCLLVVVGVGLWSVPAAVVAAGVVLAGVGLLVEVDE